MQQNSYSMLITKHAKCKSRHQFKNQKKHNTNYQKTQRLVPIKIKNMSFAPPPPAIHCYICRR